MRASELSKLDGSPLVIGNYLGARMNGNDFGTMALMVFRIEVLDGEMKLDDHV